MEDLVGANVKVGNDSKPTAEHVSECNTIGIYFGAHWAPPCRLFNTNLKKFETDAI